MNLLSLMEIYQIKQQSDDVEQLLLDVFSAGQLDTRLHYRTLADLILAECGEMTPRWSGTEVFLRLGGAWFKSKDREITRNLNLLEINYNPLYDTDVKTTESVDDVNNRTIETTGKETSNGETKRTPNLNETRTDNLTETRIPNLNETRTDDLTDRRTANLTDTRTPNTTETRTDNLAEETEDDSPTVARHYVSADNDGTNAVLRSRDETEDGKQTKKNTGTQQTQTTGTDATAHTGTDTNTHTGSQTKSTTGNERTTNTGTEKRQTTGEDKTDTNGTVDSTESRNDTYAGNRNTQKVEQGRRGDAQRLIALELESNKINIYQMVVAAFRDELMLRVY